MAKKHGQPRRRAHYSSDDLLRLACVDLEADIQHAERDGLVEYAQACRLRLERMRKAPHALVIDRILRE